MDNKLKITIAAEKHFSAIANIYNESILGNQATMEELEHEASDIKNWIANFNDREKLYVLLDEEKVLGWGIIKRYSDRGGYRFACETAIYLKSTETGKGLGTYFKKFIIEECKRLKYNHLVAKIWANNQGSIEYNENLGYTIVGQQNKIGFRDGAWQDVVIMQYLIDPD